MKSFVSFAFQWLSSAGSRHWRTSNQGIRARAGPGSLQPQADSGDAKVDVTVLNLAGETVATLPLELGSWGGLWRVVTWCKGLKGGFARDPCTASTCHRDHVQPPARCNRGNYSDLQRIVTDTHGRVNGNSLMTVD